VEWVLLLDTSTLGLGVTLGGADNRLDFGRVDQTANISLGDNVGWEEEVLLEGRWGGGGTVDGVKSLEGGGGPDDEATEVTTWGELEEVESVDGASLNTSNVAESKGKLLSVNLWVVDDQWATTLAVAAASQLTLTSTELAGSLDLADLSTGTDGVQETDGSSSAGDGGTSEDLRVDDKRNLWDGGDLVTTGKEESWDGRSSEGRGSSETSTIVSTASNFFKSDISPLTNGDLLVPLAPDLGWGEHATRTAHVTESSLTSTVSSTTGDTWNTGDGTTCKISASIPTLVFSSPLQSSPSNSFSGSPQNVN
jgi:hypothetical protein